MANLESKLKHKRHRNHHPYSYSPPPSGRAQALTAGEVEDTLNNSNDLFLTFRKEMEDMSKKTKKLEKENDNYKRKHDALNQNIFKLAEERTKLIRDLDDIRKKNDKLTSIIGQMQQQGRGIPQGMQGTVESCFAPTTSSGVEGTGPMPTAAVGVNGSEAGELDDGDDEASEYEYDEDEEEVSEGEFDDDDTEEELLPTGAIPGAYGPERPPNPPHVAAAVNGHRN